MYTYTIVMKQILAGTRKVQTGGNDEQCTEEERLSILS